MAHFESTDEVLPGNDAVDDEAAGDGTDLCAWASWSSCLPLWGPSVPHLQAQPGRRASTRQTSQYPVAEVLAVAATPRVAVALWQY